MQVIGKLGNGVITNIITKSTGYSEVTYASGQVRKEIKMNLTDANGVKLTEKNVYISAPAEGNAKYIKSIKKDLNDAKYSQGIYKNQ
jgi:hypothetical protein